ncbi:hypothetical protein SprV_0902656200 [Sparganum proliferum]
MPRQPIEKVFCQIEYYVQQLTENRFNHQALFWSDVVIRVSSAPENLPIPNDSVETRWCQQRNAIHFTVVDVLSLARRYHQDWFDDNAADNSNLLACKNRVYRAYLDRSTDSNNAAFHKCRCLAQQDAWIARKAEKILSHADSTEKKNFFAEIKESQILRRWAEHFRSVLSRSSTISDAAIYRLPQVKINNDLDPPFSLPETIRAVQQLSNGKALGSNAISTEIYKQGGHRIMDHLTMLFEVR